MLVTSIGAFRHVKSEIRLMRKQETHYQIGFPATQKKRDACFFVLIFVASVELHSTTVKAAGKANLCRQYDKRHLSGHLSSSGAQGKACWRFGARRGICRENAGFP